MLSQKTKQLQQDAHGQGESVADQGEGQGEVLAHGASDADFVGPCGAVGAAAAASVGHSAEVGCGLRPQRRRRSKGPAQLPGPRLHCGEIPGSLGPQQQDGRAERQPLSPMREQEGRGQQARLEAENGRGEGHAHASDTGIDAKTANKLFIRARNSFRKEHWTELQSEAMRAEECLVAIDHSECREESKRCRSCKASFKEEVRRFIDRESSRRFFLLPKQCQQQLVPEILPALRYRDKQAEVNGAQEASAVVAEESHDPSSLVTASVAASSNAKADEQKLDGNNEVRPQPTPLAALLRLEGALCSFANELIDGSKVCDNAAARVLAGNGVAAALKFVKDHAVMVARRDLKTEAETELKGQGCESLSELRKGILQYVRDRFKLWLLFDDPRYERYLFAAAVEKGFPFEAHLRACGGSCAVSIEACPADDPDGTVEKCPANDQIGSVEVEPVLAPKGKRTPVPFVPPLKPPQRAISIFCLTTAS